MSLKLNEKYNGFTLEKSEELMSIGSKGYLFRHEKSGARLVFIENDDNNKVFSVAFKTTPKDNTGVPHILEHSVLNGSIKYPIKDPFNELVKGSLNTFLNAMTFSDKTMYPVASCNDKDFSNLCDVYMDSVFNPRIYETPETFYQEGWRYEMFDKDDELKINGIVYNEMKGAFSDPEQVLMRYGQNVLFPDNTYGYESGGDPVAIPDLTYEAFLGFHKKLYHPSNSYILLYGNLDIEEKLAWLNDEYLKKYDRITIDSNIEAQKPFTEQKYKEIEISVSENESLEDKSILSYNFVCGDALNTVETTAMEVLEYVLLGSQGAELKQALMDAKIGKSVYGYFDGEVLQPNLKIIAQNADKSKVEEFKSIIDKKLLEIAQRGIDKKLLKAAINRFEFRSREADFGRAPKGLVYGIQMMGTWLYDDNRPFDYLDIDKIFGQLKEKVSSDYFENLIKKFLIGNAHSAIVVAVPKVNLSKENDDKLAAKLAEYKSSLSEEEIQKIVDLNLNLREYQNSGDTEEALATMPVLHREDIKKEAEPLINREIKFADVDGLLHETNTNDITYIKMLFDIKKLNLKATAYVKLVSLLLTALNTDKNTYSELSTEININSGGINFSTLHLPDRKANDDYIAKFTVNAKMFPDKITRVFELIDEIIFTSDFADVKRLKELIAEQKSNIEGEFIRAGHLLAMTRSASNYSTVANYMDATNGIYFYNFLCEIIEKLDTNPDEIIADLRDVMKNILTKENMLVSVTCANQNDEIKTITQSLEKITSKLLDFPENNYPIDLNMEKKKEAFTSSGKVQYVAMTGNIEKNGSKSSGAIKVLTAILGKDFLYNNIRVQGGAYGAIAIVRNDTDICFSSYRDPNLTNTIDVYKNMYEYILSLNLSDAELTKYIIGTFAGIDIPMTPREKGENSLIAYLIHKSFDDIQRNRDEMLNVNIDDLKACADLIKNIIAENNLCVVGGEEVINESKDLFDEIKPLLK